MKEESNFSGIEKLLYYLEDTSTTGSLLQPSSLPSPPYDQLAMQNNYSNYPQQPGTPGTPNTPGSAGMAYPAPPTTGASRPSYPTTTYASNYPPAPSYAAVTPNMMAQSSASMQHPVLAPAPAATNAGGRVTPLRPMPAGGMMGQQGMPSPYGQPGMMPQPSMLPDGEPTHVVGSQGRRGILPSAPGRPPAPQAGTAVKAPVPQKDASGKYPCTHCTKTYLHAKHLKRHMLRHTGDRPYRCVLCTDTFSRSDILKRHFQKCSQRRGNPTGATHLSHPSAHVKRQPAPPPPPGDGMNGLDNMGQPFFPAADGLPNGANDQNQLSRSSSLGRLEDPAERERRGNGGAPTREGSFQQPYGGGVPPAHMTPNIDPQMAYGMPANNHSMNMFANQNSGWTQ